MAISDGADRCLDRMGMNMAVLFCCLSDAIWFLMTTVHVRRRNIIFCHPGGVTTRVQALASYLGEAVTYTDMRFWL